jgi:hypothetical protein
MRNVLYSSRGGGNFLLHDIPVLNDFAVLHLEDIDGDKRFGPQPT